MLNQPTADALSELLGDASTDERYFGADPAVRIVFDQWPKNTSPDEVLVKVVVLNRLYSTNVYDIYGLRNHILDLQIDARLSAGDENLVNDLADVRLGGKRRWLISFASKYCAWHQPDKFQIFDSSVEWLLWEYNKALRFAQFSRFELREYPKFVEVLQKFRSRFGLEQFTRKQIDKFLWIEAKRRTQ